MIRIARDTPAKLPKDVRLDFIKEPPQAMVQEAIRRIVEVAHPFRIVLFGTAAREGVLEDSDLDLLVVCKSPIDRLRMAGLVYVDMTRFGLPIDVLVVSEKSLNEMKDDPGYIGGTALNEGRPIDPAAGVNTADSPCTRMLALHIAPRPLLTTRLEMPGASGASAPERRENINYLGPQVREGRRTLSRWLKRPEPLHCCPGSTSSSVNVATSREPGRGRSSPSKGRVTFKRRGSLTRAVGVWRIPIRSLR